MTIADAAGIVLETLLTGLAVLLGVCALTLLVAWADAGLAAAYRRWQYTRYMRSAAWQAKRQAALSAAGYRCQQCGGRQRLEVHHLTYKHFKRERPEELEVLCKTCHKVADAQRGAHATY
jgi:apolipoprotein N-acyltransferase